MDGRAALLVVLADRNLCLIALNQANRQTTPRASGAIFQVGGKVNGAMDRCVSLGNEVRSEVV